MHQFENWMNKGKTKTFIAIKWRIQSK